jgi:hypothetical protein
MPKPAQAHAVPARPAPTRDLEARVEDLLAQMTLEEKIGQLTQVSGNLTQ